MTNAIKGRLSLGIPSGGGRGCVDHVDYFGAIRFSSAWNATVVVGAGETLVVTGTIDKALLAGHSTVRILADGTDEGSLYAPWDTGGVETATISNVFTGLSAGDHTIGFFVDDVAVTDGQWAFVILHCASTCVYVHIATGS